VLYFVFLGGTVGVIIMKLGMYMLCRGSSDSSVQAFALDHINDVVVNAVGLAGEILLHPNLLRSLFSYWECARPVNDP
jgi:hypothetical protein